MDPRVARSRMQLQEALLALARERALDEITIADITTRAGVNRSTFYQHYADKDTLLADALEEAVDAATNSLRDLVMPDPAGPADPMPRELHTYLVHIADNAALYRRVLGDHGSGVVAARLREHIGAIATDVLTRVVPQGVWTVPIDVVGDAMGGTALGVVTAWLRREPLPDVDVAAAWLWEMLNGPAVHDLL